MKRVILMVIALLLCVSMLTGCDPAVMFEEIEADYNPKPLLQGYSSVIEITYPLPENNLKWTDKIVEILDGDDIVEIFGLSIAGLQPGTALLQVSATAHVPFMGITITRVTLSTEIEVVVE